MTGKREKVHRTSAFWLVAKSMHLRSSEWMPTSGYELRKQVQLDKKRWTFCFKLHVVSELDDALENWAGIRFRSTVTIWPPPKLNDREEEEITRLGWYRKAKKRVASYGYKGEWTTMPQVGRWGNFEKELGSVADVRREAKVLEKLSASPEWILTGEDPQGQS